MTDATTTYEITWDHTKSIAQEGPPARDAMVPVARWKGFRGTSPSTAPTSRRFLDYNEEIDHFGEAVMPLMREAGLRY